MRVTAVDVAHRFPGTDILFEHVGFTVEPGEVVALCGPSGCGKSTLLSILAGWERPWAGHIEREGIDRIGWVFQNPYGVSARTALDHVVFPLLAKGMTRSEAEEQAHAALALFALDDAADRQFSELSGGEAQRLMLARAVCAHPDMLLVDEPTAQLDTRTAESVSHVLGNLAGQGMIVFVATHDPRTRDACDRVIDLADYASSEGEDEKESERLATAREAIAMPPSSAEAASDEPSAQSSTAQSSTTPTPPAAPHRMRMRSLVSEAHRNLSLGVTHALAFLLVLLAATLLLGGYDAATVIGLQNQAVARVSAMGDARQVMGGVVDGVACDRLSLDGDGARESGALRSDDFVQPLATPRQEVPVYEVSPGMIRLIVDSQRDAPVAADSTGVWVSRDLADLFGLGTGSTLPTNRGTLTIAGIYEWPNDGRDTRLAFAFLVPVSAADVDYQECWASQWPLDDQLDALLYTTVKGSGGASSAGVMAVNKGFPAWDADAAYRGRQTRVVPWIGLGVGVLCGAVCTIRRRLEYAGALHAGQSKGAQLLGVAMETGVWAGLAAICSCLLLAGLCVRRCPADVWTVAGQVMRVPIAGFAGAMLAALAAGLLIRESRLLRYFKNR